MRQYDKNISKKADNKYEEDFKNKYRTLVRIAEIYYNICITKYY